MLDVPKLHAQKNQLTAAQVKVDCPTEMTDLGERIAAHLDKAKLCDKKAENHRISAGQLLAQAKEACDESGFEAFRERFCPDLGRTRVYELLSIASGKKTEEEIRANNTIRVQRHRAKAAAANAEPSVTVTDEAHPTPAAPSASPASSPLTATSEPLTPEAKVEPTVEEAEAEVKRLKALKAKIDANRDDSKIDPKDSAHALSQFKYACKAWLPKMNADDLQDATERFADVVDVRAADLLPDLKVLQFDLKIAKAEVTALKRKLAGKLPPKESRAATWSRLASEAADNIEELINYQGEFEEARDTQPDNLRDGPFAQKCDEVCGIDLELALEAVREAVDADLPLGFGRD